MAVVTVRLNDEIGGFVNLLCKGTSKSKSEVVRELLTKAVDVERTDYWLGKYQKREVTLRRVARELDVPLWQVIEMVGENQPYALADLQRDLRAIGE